LNAKTKKSTKDNLPVVVDAVAEQENKKEDSLIASAGSFIYFDRHHGYFIRSEECISTRSITTGMNLSGARRSIENALKNGQLPVYTSQKSKEPTFPSEMMVITWQDNVTVWLLRSRNGHHIPLEALL
jgi:hypothetical protein